uniref:Uncharacterized protein n=1 Tax=Tenebrio molitor TaxID=7067 RepID=A0A8J6L694_TENMO|nr:hypothetical protein GEV33_014972 [Tenebrio molitor]
MIIRARSGPLVINLKMLLAATPPARFITPGPDPGPANFVLQILSCGGSETTTIIDQIHKNYPGILDSPFRIFFRFSIIFHQKLQIFVVPKIPATHGLPQGSPPGPILFALLGKIALARSNLQNKAECNPIVAFHPENARLSRAFPFRPPQSPHLSPIEIPWRARSVADSGRRGHDDRRATKLSDPRWARAVPEEKTVTSCPSTCIECARACVGMYGTVVGRSGADDTDVFFMAAIRVRPRAQFATDLPYERRRRARRLARHERTLFRNRDTVFVALLVPGPDPVGRTSERGTPSATTATAIGAGAELRADTRAASTSTDGVNNRETRISIFAEKRSGGMTFFKQNNIHTRN